MLQGRECEVPPSSKSHRSSNKIQSFSQCIARTAIYGLKAPEQRNLSQVLEEKCLCSEKPQSGGQGEPDSWICPSLPSDLWASYFTSFETCRHQPFPALHTRLCKSVRLISKKHLLLAHSSSFSPSSLH